MAPGAAAPRAHRALRTHRSTVGAAVAFVSVVVAGAVTAVEDAAAGPPPSRPAGDSRVVAELPAAPGYPEGVALLGKRVYVATAARFGTSVVPPTDPPEVQVFDRRTGALLATHVVIDKKESDDHGLSGLAFDADGRLYVLSTQWGIVRFDPATAPDVIDPGDAGSDGSYLYANMFENLTPCPRPDHPRQCSPGSTDAPPLPNDLAFDAAGNLYVTDSLQATIWRVRPPTEPGQPPSTPEQWLRDEKLSGAFGPNGIRFDRSGSVLYLTVTADQHGAGHLYSIDVEAPRLMSVRPYLAAEVIDNLAFGRSGRLYVALAGTNQIQVLTPRDGKKPASFDDSARYSGPAMRADGSSVPYDMPSGVALDNSTKSLLVNNHSEVLGKADHFIVFDVFVDDTAEPLIRPVVP